MNEDSRPIVIDNGSGSMKAGFAGDEAPTAVFPSIVGIPRPSLAEVMVGMTNKDCYVGDAAQASRGTLSLSYPIEHGVVLDWDGVIKVWQHTFYNELRVNPEEHPVLLTEAPLNPRKNREKMVEIMLEQFKVPGVYVSVQAILALFASGRTTGVVLDCGDGVTHVVPIYEGYCAPMSVRRLDVAGRDMTEYLVTLLRQNGHAFRSSAEREIVRDIKEKTCCVALDYEEEMRRGGKMEKSYMLPDGQEVVLDQERIECPEVLFKPSLLGFDEPGVHELLYNAIRRCEMTLQPSLFENVLLSGGTTLLPNFRERLMLEVKSLVLDRMSVNISAPETRKYSVWIGGSTLASLGSFQKSWITKEEYEECGNSVIRRKCF